MTTKPTARNYRVRRPSLRDAMPGPEAGPADGRTQETAGPSASPGPDASPEQELEAIRRENLTGRQLRMARRIAQKHGLEPASDIDAVRILRRKGIDPFKPSDVMNLIAPGADTARDRLANQPGAPKQPARPTPAAPQPDAEIARAQEIRRIQRDIARRRRLRVAFLAARLAVFVLLPTLAAAYYYFKVATPLYATQSEFVIQQADGGGGGGQLGGLFAGTQFATTQDSITVQSYLLSREAMLRLDRDKGFKAHFSQPGIDPVQRLPEGATNEAAYRLYKRHVTIGYDPTEGLIRMEVAATSPEKSAEFSRALISYAEEQVDNLTRRLRADQMAGARDSYEEAERKMLAAQDRVLELQKKRGVLSAEMEVSAQMNQISTFEVELRNERLKLERLLDNAAPNATRVEVARANIARLENMIARMRDEMTGSAGGSASLAEISGELVVAQADLETRQALLAQALQQLETARIEANRQVRYLSLGVSPVVPDEPSYPRAAENTLLAFLIFGGLYLMLSLTAAILREQVTA
ncbi:capsule biosynthesis protein [Rhodovulum sp. YNF3179]|uniref:capsule biosynthesis protein n=1 Tax=Rhodovulum sp. YNF3179 TaxID=3425127 RepID=UPI003D32EF0D